MAQSFYLCINNNNGGYSPQQSQTRTMKSITDYAISYTAIQVEADNTQTTDIDTPDFALFVAQKNSNQGWMASGDRIVIPNPAQPTAEVYDIREFEKRFKGDFFDDLLIEYCNENDLQWETIWEPQSAFDTAETDAKRDFYRTLDLADADTQKETYSTFDSAQEDAWRRFHRQGF